MRERTRILLLPSARTIHDQPNDARFFSFLMTVWMDVLLASPQSRSVHGIYCVFSYLALCIAMALGKKSAKIIHGGFTSAEG